MSAKAAGSFASRVEDEGGEEGKEGEGEGEAEGEGEVVGAAREGTMGEGGGRGRSARVDGGDLDEADEDGGSAWTRWVETRAVACDQAILGGGRE